MRNKTLLAASLLLVGPSIQAQQTIEGAQAFLSQVVDQGATTVEIDNGNGWNDVRAEESFCRYYSYDTASGIRAGETRCEGWSDSTYHISPYPATASVASSKCTTEIKSPIRYSDAVTRNERGKNYWLVMPHIPNGPFKINWSNVAEVQKTGSSVTILGTKPAFRFNLPADQLAARVAFAMEFLRVNCDTTSATGF